VQANRHGSVVATRPVALLCDAGSTFRVDTIYISINRSALECSIATPISLPCEEGVRIDFPAEEGCSVASFCDSCCVAKISGQSESVVL
jgi:hypothetical protein